MDLSLIKQARIRQNLSQTDAVGNGFFFSLRTIKRFENKKACNGTIITLWNLLDALGLKMVSASVSHAYDYETTVDSLDVLGDLVSCYRDECFLTQEEVASATRLSTNTIYNIEAGRTSPRFLTVMRLDRLLGLNLKIVQA